MQTSSDALTLQCRYRKFLNCFCSVLSFIVHYLILLTLWALPFVKERKLSRCVPCSKAKLYQLPDIQLAWGLRALVLEIGVWGKYKQTQRMNKELKNRDYSSPVFDLVHCPQCH